MAQNLVPVTGGSSHYVRELPKGRKTAQALGTWQRHRQLGSQRGVPAPRGSYMGANYSEHGFEWRCQGPPETTVAAPVILERRSAGRLQQVTHLTREVTQTHFAAR